MPETCIQVDALIYEVEGQRLLDIDAVELRGPDPVVILGPNGAGKSLFLRMLHGLIEPTSGGVLFNGQRTCIQIRRSQSMVFQSPVLLRRSVSANINYALKTHKVPRAARRHKVRDLLVKSNLQEHADQPARTLSGGEQQRLAMIRALASEPVVLFLDEPTSSLDPGASIAIEEMIVQASDAGTKIVLVTHDLGFAKRMAGEILFFHHGKICEQAPVARFFAAPDSEPAKAFLASKMLL